MWLSTLQRNGENITTEPEEISWVHLSFMSIRPQTDRSVGLYDSIMKSMELSFSFLLATLKELNIIFIIILPNLVCSCADYWNPDYLQKMMPFNKFIRNQFVQVTTYKMQFHFNIFIVRF